MIPPGFENRLFTAAQSRDIDRRTIEELGIPGFTLMEVAAQRAADHIFEMQPGPVRVLSFCGKGNNAGDALAVSRLLLMKGFSVDVCLALGKTGMSADAAANLRILEKMLEADPELPLRFFEGVLPGRVYCTVIDGLFGTGLQRDVTGPLAEMIAEINRWQARVFAMDIPSGLHADSGAVMGTALQAHTTLMFGTAKAGCYLGRGAALSGKRVLCPLPFPAHLLREAEGAVLRSLSPGGKPQLENKLRKLREGREVRHKYQNGNVYVLGGSPGLTGAVILTAKAAWSTGCGSVQVFTTPEVSPAYDAHFVDITRKMIPGDGSGLFKADAVRAVAEVIAARPGVLVLGPGLGTHPETAAAVRQLLRLVKAPVVLDADGVRALSGHTEKLPDDLRLIVTPHPGEQEQLLGFSIAQPEQLAQALNHFPCRDNMVFLAKGSPALLATRNECRITTYDTRIFSRTGFGDVLAGLMAGMLSRLPDSTVTAESMLDVSALAMLESYARATCQHESAVSPSAPEAGGMF
ncbi:NAD(P)H-hydrate epimerase [Cyclonatronum proteinivorum]|uniref:Bifunctional NAD(P)H-hydrate repair enzyme n=1 Tax=Cyclonatronum proteinivorum TaxID=1457365 RepID=A0A345UHS8_9BACT|nr:NAD(P)H-hydrate dehydratase [Cyclonatronum proteinivorum]AXJ00030.1 NAD(P)H-hydrate epimerase [Cyclonatronum proteinivorum]